MLLLVIDIYWLVLVGCDDWYVELWSGMLIMLVCVLLVIVMVCLGSVMFWVGECFVLCNL